MQSVYVRAGRSFEGELAEKENNNYWSYFKPLN